MERPLRHSELGVQREKMPHSPLQERIDYEIRNGMNNFVLHLPFYDDDQPGFSGYRAIKRRIGVWDVRYIDFSTRKETHKLNSRRFLYQTASEFYETVDTVAQSLGVDLEELRRYHIPIEEEGGMNRLEQRDFKYNQIASIYRRLRTIGYTEYDLVT